MPLRLFGFAAFLLVSISAFADAGRITRVVLYPRSATVERSAQVPAGSSKVDMSGLPANFDLRTLRVEADPGIRIGEVAVQEVSRRCVQ